MVAKVIAALMNWLLVSILMPAIAYAYDTFRLRKQYAEISKKIEDLKNAKTKAEIDSAIDNIP